MKMTIEWHKKCLANMKASLAQEEAVVERIRARLDRTVSTVDFYASQITQAENKRKNGFDSEKFMRKARHLA